MLITNGIVTRNIAASQLAEYKARGYREADAPSKAEAKAETPKPKKAAKSKAGDN